MGATYSRVTVVGRRRRMDAVLPVDEPLGKLLPDLMQMLDEPVERWPRRRFLTTVTGEQVAPEYSLASAQLGDGAVLRLMAEGELPPPPTVYDITEETVDDLDRRATAFQPRHRRALAGAALVVSVLAGVIALVTQTDSDLALFLLLVLTTLTGFVGVVLGRYQRPVVGIPLLSIATGCLSIGLVVWAVAGGWSVPMAFAAGAAGVGIGAVLFAGAGLARGGVLGGTVTVAFAVCWIGGVRLGIDADRVGVVAGALSVLVLGLLPRLGLAMSGLTALDDRRAQGVEVQRTDVHSAINAAHLGIALATVPVAVSSVASAVVMLRAWNGWSISVAVLLAFLLASRARLYPLLTEVAVLCAAALSIMLVLTFVLSTKEAGGALIAVGLLVVVGMVAAFGMRPESPQHLQARAAQILDAIEVAAMIAFVPLAFGVFDLYAKLLNVA
ncbi:type VII secretion integral membrane protein EccD [Kribbella pratensis]|uniref:Type VII secretion integral membrane protein EccD n=1 Tax=Kribbella pratensis TaxID=2512112 RepID=A0ABY2F7C6_9ACTN|nr:type VII secretion integral membrane protein EccD [Kribbella pratensis]TDW84174.1 type VII secretion integral membrane protein EccD [Kribbella pratensis]